MSSWRGVSLYTKGYGLFKLTDNIDLLGPYRADVVTCKPYNQRTEQISYFVDHFNEQLKTDS